MPAQTNTYHGSVPASERDRERASRSFEKQAAPASHDPDKAPPFVYAGQNNMAFVTDWREEMGL